MNTDLSRLVERMRSASRVTVVTGAGVSAASGVPTFRGADGLWSNFRVEELATPEAFARDPRLVWEWYSWRRELLAACRPNRAHEVLAGWSRRYPRFTLITQNVDGLHERAGTENVVRFHGSLWELACWEGCAKSPAQWRDDTVPFRQLPPRCPHCGGIARPGVVWFGEPIDPSVLEKSLSALDCEVCLVVGTSAIVYPAAGLADEAHQRGAFTVEINPEATEATSRFDLALQGVAEEVLDRLDRFLAERGGAFSGSRFSSSQ
ncbi:MAG TPA: NAD-dependent deacylase [Thermoanaerobaculia bacterium]|nr:NAD-dependent deacylase [Thermoanaerobaculia bacterium]